MTKKTKYILLGSTIGLVVLLIVLSKTVLSQ